MKNTLLTLGLLLFYSVLNGQDVITDFLQTERDKNSYPTNFVEFNDNFYFVATTESEGREVWFSNGNEDETHLLKDINPGNNSGIQNSFIKASVIINNTLYFIANDGESNGEIWKTDGTTDGTEKVTDFLNSNIYNLTLVGANFYFLIQNDYSLQVWLSDGTSAGTRMVKENLPIWNAPSFQGKCNNTFIFTFQPYGSNDSRVWRSDGTSDGTYPITEEIDGNGAGLGGSSDLTQYIEYNDELYFVIRSGRIFGYSKSVGIMKTDGTLENTVPIKALHAGSLRLIDFADVICANGKLYFSFLEVDYNRLFIWESDGTELGSSVIYDEWGTNYFMTSNLIAYNDHLIFCGVNNTGGTSLIKLNLIDYSLNHLKELQETSEPPFIFSSYYDICNIQIINEHKIFCSSPKTRYQRKGWISDLQEENINNIEVLDNVTSIFSYKESIYFSKYTSLEGAELWKSDTNHESFYLLDNINKSKYGLINMPLLSLNSKLVFTADNGLLGDELWCYDGTVNLLKDIRKGIYGSYPNSFVYNNSEIFFVASDTIHGAEIWKTNGTELGTVIAHDIIEGPNSAYPKFLTSHKGIVYFVAYKDEHYHLCKYDEGNVEFIKDLGENEYGVGFCVEEMISAGDYLYFVTSGAGDDLWVSDGTGIGTYKIKDFISCNNLTNVEGKLFCTASEMYIGEIELWKSDGTKINTQLVKDIGLGYSSEPKDLINFNGMLFFTAISNESGRELWKSDGTDDGTVEVADINKGIESSIIDANFCVLNNTLFFSARNNEDGIELWKTDGSEIGTKMVKDINSGLGSSFPSELVALNDLVYFQAFDADHGSELWKTDGTEEGTLLVADIVSGYQSSSPSNILLVDENVFFIAETDNMGRQIWNITYNTVSSIPELLSKTEITIYPNPCYDFVNFTTDSIIENVSIYNSNGKLVSVGKVVNGRVDISKLPIGIYLLRIKTNGKITVKKVIKK